MASRTPKPKTPHAAAPPALALSGSLSLQQGSRLLGGADRIALLRAIHATGSVTQAAKVVGISYKTAWDRVQDMNNVAARPLVDRSTGGAGGGGATLTPYALELVAAFERLEHTHAQVLDQLSKTLSRPGDVLQTLSSLALRTSARNQLGGTVTRIVTGAVNALVELALPPASAADAGQPAVPPDTLSIAITMTSLEELGVVEGQQAVALIKAPSVFLARPEPALRLSVRNQLPGRVLRVREGAVNTEVQLRLRGGQTMVATVSRDSALALGVAEGQDVLALVQDTSIVLGVV